MSTPAHAHPTTLYTWINEICGALEGENGLPDRFELWFLADDGGERLETLRLADRPEDHTKLPDVLSGMLWQIAEAHAATLNQGQQLRYAVQMYREENHKVPDSVRHFILQGQAQNTLALGSSMNAAQGQLIRHNENLHGMMMTLTHAVHGRLASELENERNARHRAEQQLEGVRQLALELEDRKHERQIETERERRSAERLDQMIALGASLLPAVLARLGTQNAAPNAQISRAVMRDRAVGQLMNSLTGSDIEKLAAVVRPELQPALLELLSVYADEQKQQQTPPPTPQPQNGARSDGASTNGATHHG